MGAGQPGAGPLLPERGAGGAHLPAHLLTLVLVTGCAAFFFARDMGKLKAGLRGLCGDRAAGCLKNAARSSTGAGAACLLSYLLLTFITFCQACIILSILGIDYPLHHQPWSPRRRMCSRCWGRGWSLPAGGVPAAVGGVRQGIGAAHRLGGHHPGPAGGRAPAGGGHRKGPPLDDAGRGVLLSGGGQPVGAPVRAGAVPALRRLPGERSLPSLLPPAENTKARDL